jgi:hypothetical protein
MVEMFESWGDKEYDRSLPDLHPPIHSQLLALELLSSFFLAVPLSLYLRMTSLAHAVSLVAMLAFSAGQNGGR